METAVEVPAAAPETEVLAKTQRRRFTAEYKRRVLKGADAMHAIRGDRGSAEAERQGLWVTAGELSTMDRDEFAITLQILRNSGEVLPAVGPQQEIEGTQHRFLYA